MEVHNVAVVHVHCVGVRALVMILYSVGTLHYFIEPYLSSGEQFIYIYGWANVFTHYK